ncbi:SDR family NAD(P)-dependent oxidoreductase [Streptomyces sp. NPDC005483]|uniref:SDR family NAD(P)-dependent oxidoreductase n=1 Tax=Streptomyces sp. NPDC005483 TaxID=3154882 RepID=UPI0033BD5644
MIGEVACRSARVALRGHKKRDLDEQAVSLPVPALAVEVDIMDPAALRAAARPPRQGLGRLSAVPGNEGVAEVRPFADPGAPTWQAVIDVNLTGSAHTSHTLLTDLRALSWPSPT